MTIDDDTHDSLLALTIYIDELFLLTQPHQYGPNTTSVGLVITDLRPCDCTLPSKTPAKKVTRLYVGYCEGSTFFIAPEILIYR